MTARSLPRKDVLPRALYTAEQVRAFDRLAIEHFDIPGLTLMERAGRAAFELMRQRWPDARRICVLAGTGNNAGDGFVVARLAHAEGIRVEVLQLGERERLRGDAAANAERWRELGGRWLPYEGIAADTELIVDALLGTGLEREVGGPWAAAIGRVPIVPRARC